MRGIGTGIDREEWKRWVMHVDLQSAKGAELMPQYLSKESLLDPMRDLFQVLHMEIRIQWILFHQHKRPALDFVLEEPLDWHYQMQRYLKEVSDWSTMWDARNFVVLAWIINNDVMFYATSEINVRFYILQTIY
ncbi:hypothetical protein POTOM_034557 [Populus tomentosa]|uniref:Uncharacterized protein n=1 Tax=Populus tomentosa TaxID=118781 RepID=A0A8X7Z5K0_POPTO|nr:hypothetical protein POTOM_034557 [Populus tomentosa]